MGRLALLLLVAVVATSASSEAHQESHRDGLFIKPTFADEPTHVAFLQEFKAAHPARMSNRQESGLDAGLHDRAMLFFRSIDADHDKLITRKDALASADKLNRFVPGITSAEFSSFIQAADTNGDKALDVNEFVHAFAQGLSSLQSSNSPLLLETTAGIKATSLSKRMGVRSRRVGFLGDVGNAIGNAFNRLGSHLSGKLDTSQDSCVMCQYIMERCEGNVRQSGVIPSFAQQQSKGGAMLEESDDVMLEVEASQDMTATQSAKMISASHDGTRYRRLVERQKYNEIYRVVDITLDDVCESGMPNNFYGYCKAIYQTQSDVVDGLRYQYRPSDICFRIGMCDKKSYVAQGIHSRYKSEA